ncbi:putative late blight resistance protein homolog R1B-17 [Coffea arabica]|uniref:Late blight resistance protein homolog R1B-17 n=1 Tax=Coffea arabica TaxID=13443 RepID=A0A6P6TVD8_COFAR
MDYRRRQQDSKYCPEIILDKLQLLGDEGVFSVDDSSFRMLKRDLEDLKDFIPNARALEDSFFSLLEFVLPNGQQFYSYFGLDQEFSRFHLIGEDCSLRDFLKNFMQQVRCLEESVHRSRKLFSPFHVGEASTFRDILKNFRQDIGCLEDSIHQNWKIFYLVLLKDGLPPTGDSCLLESLVNLKQQIRHLCGELWNSMVQFFSESTEIYSKLLLEHGWTGEWYSSILDRLQGEHSSWTYELMRLFNSFREKFCCFLRIARLRDSRLGLVVALFERDLKAWNVSSDYLWKRTEGKSNINEQNVVVALFATHLCFLLFRGDNQVFDGTDICLSTNTMTCIDSILDFCKDDHALNELKVELRLVKTFFLCARKLCNPSKTGLLEDSVKENGQQFNSFLLQLEDGLHPRELAGAASNFRRILKNCRQKISEMYVEMLDFLLKSVSQGRDRYDYCNKSHNSYLESFLESSSPSRDEFLEFFYLLLENLEDIVIWGEACDSRLAKLLEPLQEKLVFLKNFILFASLQGKPKRNLLEHCAVAALSAAHLSYICWSSKYDNQELDGLGLKISELIDKIKPFDHRALLTYIRVVESGSTSPTLSTKKDIIIVGEFVDSLLGHLWELLLNCPPCLMVSLKHQLRMLYEGLQFLRNILTKEKCDGLDERIKDLVGALVNDAGLIIFSLYQNNIREASAKKIDIQLFCLLEKIKIIMAEVEEKYPVVSNFNFLTTNALGLIDLLQEKLKEVESYEVDPLFSFAEDRVHLLRSYLKNAMEQHNQDANLQAQTIQEDLSFLKSFLKNNLEQHTEKEKLHIQTMRDGLVFLRSFLENNRDQHDHLEELQALRSSIMEVAHKTEFVIDSLIVGDVSFYSLMLFDEVTEEIELLKTKIWEFDCIKAQKPTNSSRDVPQAGSKWTGAFHQVPSQGNISTIHKTSVYLKDQEQAIIDQLIGGSMQLDIISIVGMPGLGKTFLAQRVYHDPSIASHFHILAWCCISQVYCKKDLLLGILGCIDPKAQYSEMDEDDLAHKLCNHLRKQKYLIVLDDVWDIEAWNALKISFPDYANGSRIILTSRHHGITGKPHHLRALDEEESWELLEKKLSITIEDGYPVELSVLGRQIAKNCNGLPLSIVIISGILGTLDQGRWGEVAERLDSNSKIGATEQCKSILELSYIHLPDHLKPCLLYFSAFREDQEISVKKLIWLWIAEGFLQKKESESLEKLAEGYLIDLINRSLVMEGQKRSIGGVKTCHIHDLLHVFCLGKAKDKKFLHLMQGCDGFLNFDEPHYLYRLSIHSQPKHFAKSKIFCSHVRSLLHSSRGIGSRGVSYNLSFVCHLKLLQVLDLEQINLGFTFLCELGLLIQLRYLAVSGWIKYIPPSLENLSNLETFCVTTYYSDFVLSSLEDIFWKLQKLRHLQVRGALIDLRLAKENPESSCMLYNLHTFSTPKLYLGQSMEKMMMKFPNIRRLKCCLLQSEETCSESTRIVAMDSLSQLESLKLLLGKVTANCIEFHLPI